MYLGLNIYRDFLFICYLEFFIGIEVEYSKGKFL